MTSDPGELRPPLIAGAGVFIGASMLALSVTGLLWRIDALSFGLCFLAAALASGLWLRRSGARPGIPLWSVLLLVPLLVLPAVASLSPPFGWDEVAYGAALPRDYARAGRFFYNADYGPYSAFPANYQHYLDRPYFHIHPMTEKGNLQALQTPDEYLQAFRSLGLTWLGFWRFRDSARYPEANTPRRHAFLLRFFRARGALERSGKITFVTRVGDVRVYRIEAPAAISWAGDGWLRCGLLAGVLTGPRRLH